MNTTPLLKFCTFRLIIIYAVKTIFLAFLTYRQNIIIENLYAYLSINLFKRYIVQPYKYHLNRDLE